MSNESEVCAEVELNQKKILDEVREIFQRYSLDLMLVTAQRAHPTGTDTLHTHQSTWLMTPQKTGGGLISASDLIRIQQHASNICLEHATSLLESVLKDLNIPGYEQERSEIRLIRQCLMAGIDSNTAMADITSLLLKRAITAMKAKIERTREELESMPDDPLFDLEGLQSDLDIEPDPEDEALIQQVEAFIRKHGKKGIN